MGKMCDHCKIIMLIQSDLLAADHDPDADHVDDYNPVRHHSTVADLIKSADTCSLCSRIERTWSLPYLLRKFPDIYEEDFGSIELTWKLTDASSRGRDVTCNFLSGDIHVPWHAYSDTFKLTIMTCAVDSQTSRAALWNSFHESPATERNQIIRSWYTDCVSHHPECASSISEYPRRLVQIGPEKTDLRLVDTTKQTIENNTSYATLSYSWGPSQPLTTTRSNISSLLENISVDSLPKTFHNAIETVWELGLRYIWIDSLCIIQDDLNDWEREASRMKDVYAGSSITVSASDAKESTQGCFVDHSLDLWERDARGVAPMGAAISGKRALAIRIHQGDIRRRVKRSNLSTRGWTLQEQLLSHRVIHCMRPEIHWNCRHKYHTESQFTFEGARFKPFSSMFLPSNATTAEMQRLWSEWMTDYSNRNLTVTKDCIGALAGIVQYFGERTGFKHVLACWQETLIDDLLWIRNGRLADSSTILSQVPSWSWLTRVRKISFEFWHRVMGRYEDVPCDHIKILGCSVTWTGQPMVSDISSTNLIVEGPVLQMKLRIDPKAKVYNPPCMNVGDETPDFSSHPIPWRCLGQYDLEDDRQDELFTCLLVRSVTPRHVKLPYGHHLQETFLLLVPAEASEGMDYRRVGIAMIRGEESEFKSAPTQRIRIV